jgi:hypothetical protein
MTHLPLTPYIPLAAASSGRATWLGLLSMIGVGLLIWGITTILVRPPRLRLGAGLVTLGAAAFGATWVLSGDFPNIGWIEDHWAQNP